MLKLGKKYRARKRARKEAEARRTRLRDAVAALRKEHLFAPDSVADYLHDVNMYLRTCKWKKLPGYDYADEIDKKIRQLLYTEELKQLKVGESRPAPVPNYQPGKLIVHLRDVTENGDLPAAAVRFLADPAERRQFLGEYANYLQYVDELPAEDVVRVAMERVRIAAALQGRAALTAWKAAIPDL